MAITLNQAFAFAIPWATTYAKANKKYNVNPNELAKYAVAVAIKESNLNPNAKNKNSSAKGLMQIIDSTKKEIEKKLGLSKSLPTAIYNPDYAMQLGVYYLLKQFNRYGNWEDALHAYNQGSVPGVHPENGRDYASSVLKKYDDIPNSLAYVDSRKIISTDKNDYLYNVFI